MWANCSFLHCGLLQKVRIDIYVLMSLGPAIHKGRPHVEGVLQNSFKNVDAYVSINAEKNMKIF